MIGPFIMLIGIGLLYVAIKGKSAEVIVILFGDVIANAEKQVGKGVTTWFADNVWNPLSAAIRNAFTLGLVHGANQPAGGASTGSGNNALVQHIEVPLIGGGSITVNASDYNAAVQNVIAEGGNPQL